MRLIYIFGFDRGTRNSVLVSFCNLERFGKMSGTLDGWRSIKRLLLIRGPLPAKSNEFSRPVFLSTRRFGSETDDDVHLHDERGGETGDAKDAIGAPVAPKSCYLRPLSVTVISHPFVFGIALNWLARACVFPRLTRHACARVYSELVSVSTLIFSWYSIPN